MAAWPTVDDIKAKYPKLNWDVHTARLTGDLTRAKNAIRSSVGVLHDVSGMSSEAPQSLCDLVYPLVYGYITLAVHKGAQSTQSDDAGKLAYEQALEELNQYKLGDRDVIDDDGEPLPRRSYTTGLTDFTGPAMGLKDPVNYGFTRNSSGSSQWI